MRFMHIPRFAAVVAAVTLTLAGCGGSSSAKSSAKPGAAGSRDAALRDAMQKWTQATTPQLVCAEITARFKQFLTDRKPGTCAENAVRNLGDFASKPADEAKILKLEWNDPQGVVTAEITDGNTSTVRASSMYYFVSEGGSWKLNSIGELAPIHPQPDGPITP